MERPIELPLRADNHIRESTGYKVLESVIPAQWIIRAVTERDYGVDCYIELVDDKNRLTGEIAFVQMKATDAIDWRKTDNGFKFYKVERATTNYLNSFKIPTYLFLVDLTENKIYYLPIKEYIKDHYQEYLSDTISFCYEFFKDRDLFTAESFRNNFRRNNQFSQFRNELQYFISNLRQYIDFMWEHNGRDCFMQIEQEDMMFFEAMKRNIDFLQNYFLSSRKLPPMKLLIRKGITIYGKDYEQTLFEGVLTDLFEDLKASIMELVDIITEQIVNKESGYWMMEKTYIFNHFLNLNKAELFT